MKMHLLFLFLTTFLASGIEVVEMVTIVFGVGMARGWPSTLGGAAAGLAILGGIVAVLGPALTFVPISVLRATVGILLLFFGVQWLRKGIFRLSRYGFRPPASVEKADEETDLGDGPGNIDWTAFMIALKGVLLEGLEVAFIVVTFGAATRSTGLAALSAGAAFVTVISVALMIQKALGNIPRHVIKFSVGLLLATFGTYWAAEGLGVEWPGEDLSILALLGVYVLFASTCVPYLRRSLERRENDPGGPKD